jgi:endonuclease YncB( thermonuclease family)
MQGAFHHPPIDGDTVDIHTQRIRMHGVDAAKTR